MAACSIIPTGVPLAAFMAGATYFLIRATRDLPIPRMRHVIGLGVMTGAALGIRSLSLFCSLDMPASPFS